jgi:cysteine-rich repeat protein
MQYCDTCTLRWDCSHCLSGRLVADKTGCSRIVGCTSVRPLDPISDNCLACDTIEFHTFPHFGRCNCIQGWIVGLHCTTVVGCTSVTLVNNQSRCIACNAAKHFSLFGTTCIFAPHYSFTGSDCIEICGDGFVINAECDDGNLIDGDGCSSTCDVEYSYQCENDNSRSPSSKCKFKARIELSVATITKLTIQG